MDIKNIVYCTFKEFFERPINHNDTVESLGGDFLDAVEIIMAIEEDLNIILDDFVSEEKLGKLTINQLIDQITFAFNIKETTS